jgi:CRP/FNR family cyclic AMP-dependent transcriptional regulator
MPIQDPLATVPLLATLDQAARDELSRHLRRRELGAGEVLFSEGDPGDELFLVDSGEVEIFRPTSPGRERISLWRAGKGDHFGEVALLDQGRRSASAVAMIQTRMLTLSREEFLAALVRSPQVAGRVLAHLATRLRAADERLSGSASRNVVKELDAVQSAADRLAERVARVNGSWTFVFLLVAVTGAWVAWNGWSPAAFDPYPFVFFNLVLAVTVVLQGPLIMMAQNREVSVERAASEADYQVPAG